MTLQTERAYRVFIVPSTLIWSSLLLVTAWDFVFLQGMVYRFGVVNALGMGLLLMGVFIRLLGRKTLGKHYSYGLKVPERLIKHGIHRNVRHRIYLAMLFYTAGIPLIFFKHVRLFAHAGIYTTNSL